MIPGGKKFTVTKMPYGWRGNDEGRERIRTYPIIISRLGNHFNPPFNLKDAPLPLSEATLDKAVAEFDSAMTNRFQRYQPSVWIGINGHYHERDGRSEAAVLLASAEVHRRWQAANTNPQSTVLDTISLVAAHHPITVRSDHFHAGKLANYIEGLAITKTLCAHDGIPLPPAVEELVQKALAGAADKQDDFVITAPTNEEPRSTYKLGDQITLQWSLADTSVQEVYIMLHRLGHYDYFLSDRIAVDDPAFGKLVWTAADNLPTIGNNLHRLKKMDPAKAAPTPFRKKIPGGHKLFCFRIVDADNPDVYTFSPSFSLRF